MAKKQWRSGTLLSPLPAVLVTCRDPESGRDNVLTIGWTGILNSDPPRTYVSVRPERLSYEWIRKTGEFCINLPTSRMARAVDLCGVRSGRDTDKFRLARLTAEPSREVSCCSIAECPVTLECRVFREENLGSHTMFLADIVSVGVDESIIDEKGRMAIEKAGLLAYGHGTYFALGRKIGTFGFSVRKKKKS
ncbi:MAG: flavin reductase family protein [Clostridia bacterium]|nr:flavin reductase family protein [Clostridia bacterium]